MKIFVGILLGFFVTMTSVAQSQEPPTTVPNLDLEAYQGTWYEIALIPHFFQEECYTETAATYELLENGLIQVDNACLDENGEPAGVTGRGRIDPDYDSKSKLEITFLNIIDWVWWASGYYWVLEVEPNYQWSLVGHPDRDYAWILSRTKTLSIETLRQIEGELRSHGYDPCRLKMSRNSEQPFETVPNLCEYLESRSGQ